MQSGRHALDGERAVAGHTAARILTHALEVGRRCDDAELSEIRHLRRLGGLQGHGAADRPTRCQHDGEGGRIAARDRQRLHGVLRDVRIVASRTQDAAGSVEDFAAALDGRIRSMAIAHELLSTRQWQGVPMARGYDASGRAWS